MKTASQMGLTKDFPPLVRVLQTLQAASTRMNDSIAKDLVWNAMSQIHEIIQPDEINPYKKMDL